MNDIISNSNSEEILKFFLMNDGSISGICSSDTADRFENQYYIIEAYKKVYDYVLDPSLVFAKANLTKNIDDMVVKNVYFFTDYTRSTYSYTSGIIYYVTNHGDYIYYIDCFGTMIITDYLFSAESFRAFFGEIKKISQYYGADIYKDGLRKLKDDVTYYNIGGEHNIPHGSFDGYYHGVALGYATYSDFDTALKSGGYEDWSSFISQMTEAGYTTYGEYRMALDRAIAENAVRAAESDIDTAPTDISGENGGYLYLLWIIIPVAVLGLGAIIFAVVRKKKRTP